mmetsp:Transcript_42551/g.79359  ORF Transcript_42551/g.79359 Transcript_42551/m.79359 type:complete len:384 (+) Transcript_42551:262-1413(+)
MDDLLHVRHFRFVAQRLRRCLGVVAFHQPFNVGVALLTRLCCVAPLLDGARHLAGAFPFLCEGHLHLCKSRSRICPRIPPRVLKDPSVHCVGDVAVALLSSKRIMTYSESQGGQRLMVGARSIAELWILTHEDIHPVVAAHLQPGGIELHLQPQGAGGFLAVHKHALEKRICFFERSADCIRHHFLCYYPDGSERFALRLAGIDSKRHYFLVNGKAHAIQGLAIQFHLVQAWSFRGLVLTRPALLERPEHLCFAFGAICDLKACRDFGPLIEEAIPGPSLLPLPTPNKRESPNTLRIREAQLASGHVPGHLFGGALLDVGAPCGDVCHPMACWAKFHQCIRQGHIVPPERVSHLQRVLSIGVDPPEVERRGAFHHQSYLFIIF